MNPDQNPSPNSNPNPHPNINPNLNPNPKANRNPNPNPNPNANRNPNPNPNQVDDKATVLHVRGAEHILHVRGLAEKRPSVLRGDQVRANLPGERSRVWRGRAGQIEMEDVHLRFAPSFPYVAGQRVEISFMLGRTPLRLFRASTSCASCGHRSSSQSRCASTSSGHLASSEDPISGSTLL